LDIFEWLVRGLLAIGGATLVWFAWPVSKGAWQAQQVDAVVASLRLDYEGALRDQVTLGEVQLAIESLDRAIVADPTASRHLQRSELLVAAALLPAFEPTSQQRTDWLKRAEADLAFGLGNDPSRGVGWLRLAAVRLSLQGPSQKSVAPLLVSIDTAPMMQPVWPVRLRLILGNWQAFTPDQRDRVADYVARTWQLSRERRWFADAVGTPLDELFIRYSLRNDAAAQEELTRLIAARKT
jgi:hypothetical protein